MLTAQLTGGLGNQLFTYARLAVHAKNLDTTLQIDSSVVERILGHTPDLFDFKLMGEKQILKSDYSQSGAQMERLFWRWEATRRISGRYQDSILGNLGVLPTSRNGMRIRGFFQNYSVAEEFIKAFSSDPLTLKSESEKLSKYISQIQTGPTLAIHMRRGDYLNYKDSFGVLSDKYYRNALDVMVKKTKFKNILVFTDSPTLVKDFCGEISLPTKVVTAKDLSTSENLVLMSKCQGLITSNSTYSFWAAMLSTHERVITPYPWFKSSDQWLNSAKLNNPKWNNCESIWMS